MKKIKQNMYLILISIFALFIVIGCGNDNNSQSSTTDESSSSSLNEYSSSSDESEISSSSSNPDFEQSSSSVNAYGKMQATSCDNFVGEQPMNVPADPYTACFKYNDKYYTCKVENEEITEEHSYLCSSAWIWDGNNLDGFLNRGIWYFEVPAPGGASSSSRQSSSSSVILSSSSLAQSSSSDDSKENFHIYLAFGQSNMEGQNWNGNQIAYSDVLPVQYKQNVDPRFQVMTAVSGSYKLASGTQQRTQGQWYTAVPPLARPSLGLSPVDYFGRTLVAGISNENVKIGVIVVAVMGAAIEGFGKTGAPAYYSTQESWMKTTAAQYDNDPYNRLVTLAKEAQKVGVIKGILMHQGESGAASGNYGQKVKAIYDNLLSDLGLPANSIPFLAGQAYNNNNANINSIPNTLNSNLTGTTNKVAHIISSQSLTSGGDGVHFSYEGYKTLGERYGQKMLELIYPSPR